MQLPKEADWRESWALCRPHVHHFRTALDVGARRGEFARYLQEFDSVHSFDFRSCQTGYRERCAGAQYHYHQVGISNHVGTEQTTSMKVGRIKGRGGIQVPVRTIDSYQFSDVDFVKLDVEGHELQCVQGAEQTIRVQHPLLIVEQNRGNTDACDLLIEWGYQEVAQFSIDGQTHDRVMLWPI